VALFPPLLFRRCSYGLGVALQLAVVLSISVGTVSLPFGQVVRIVLQPLLPGLITAAWSAVKAQVVWQFRLPRTLLAVIIGAVVVGAALSGAALQAMVRNPLAEPYISGVSSASVSCAGVALLDLDAASRFNVVLEVTRGAAFDYRTVC